MPTIMNEMFEYIEKYIITKAVQATTQIDQFGPEKLCPPATKQPKISTIVKYRDLRRDACNSI